MSVKALFENRKVEVKEVKIDGIGTVYIKKMSLVGRMKMNEAITKNQDEPTQAQVEALKACLCESDGTPVFDDDSTIMSIDATVTDKLFEAILDFNGFDADAEKEAAKN
jgi:hypothetical protein